VRFSIITPTYNRSALLQRVFESLCAQTFKDFEWIIIDDGSEPRASDVVEGWNAPFPIIYHWQPNSGTTRALNRGFSMARGDFSTQLDDDDLFLPSALERFDYHWRTLPNPEKFACICCRCCSPDGKILGIPFPSEPLDTFGLRQILALANADCCGMIRTDILKAFPFPEFRGERFLDPGVVWNRMNQRYWTRLFNEPVKMCFYVSGHSSSRDLRWSNPKGAVVYHTELALSNAPIRMRAKSAINALRFLFVLGVKVATGNSKAN